MPKPIRKEISFESKRHKLIRPEYYKTGTGIDSANKFDLDAVIASYEQEEEDDWEKIEIEDTVDEFTQAVNKNDRRASIGDNFTPMTYMQKSKQQI